MPTAVTFVASDGKRQTFSLDYLKERDAMLVTKANGRPLGESFGGTNQLWIKGCPAACFLRDVVEITTEETEEEVAPPQIKASEWANRPNVSARLAGGPSASCFVGEPVLFEGWADDFDKAIVALRFSLDQGASWTEMPTQGAQAGRVTSWRFAYTPKREGTYAFWAKSVNEDGEESPIAAVVTFSVYARR